MARMTEAEEQYLYLLMRTFDAAREEMLKYNKENPNLEVHEVKRIQEKVRRQYAVNGALEKMFGYIRWLAGKNQAMPWEAALLPKPDTPDGVG